MNRPTKLVVATVNPFTLDAVLEALGRVGVRGRITVTEARDYSRKGRSEIYRGARYTAKIVAALKIEVAIPHDQAGRVADAISAAAGTDPLGQILVLDVDYPGQEARTTKNSERVPSRAA